MLTVVTWCWGKKYNPGYVQKLARGFERYLTEPHRFICVTDAPEIKVGVETWPIVDVDLLAVRGCFARLRMFDPAWQAEHNIDDRLVCVDLDVVITGNLNALFQRQESFVVLQGANAVNPCPFNGSLWMLRAGAHAQVWSKFTTEAAGKTRFHEFPDDQGWFWHMLPDAAGWHVGPTSGIYAFRKREWPAYDRLPRDARMVCFPGARDPHKFKHLPWIRQHWR